MDAEVRAAALTMIEPLESQVFYHATFGKLGLVHIVLPKLPSGDYHDEEVDEIFDFVERIMKRRKAWQQRKITSLVELISPSALMEIAQNQDKADES